MSILLLALALTSAEGFLLPARVGSTAARRRGGAPAMAAVSDDSVAILVDVEIVPERVEDFLKVIEADAVGSRKEAECLRFDVLRASPTRFFFYEVYTSADAVAFHKAQPHFKLWSDFKESGGVASQTSTKAGFPGGWSFA